VLSGLKLFSLSQFERSMHGDPLFFLTDPDLKKNLGILNLETVTLASVIRQNTFNKINVAKNVFFV
jgi:hypothetical protein